MYSYSYWLPRALVVFIVVTSPLVLPGNNSGLKLEPDNAHFIDLVSLSVAQSDQIIQSPQARPPVWDWRKVNGVNWLSSVRSQQGCGSCVAFGLASVFESQLKIHKGLWWWDPQISVQDLFACGGGDCETGWTMKEALGYLQANGVTDEACSPYLATSGPQSCSPCLDRSQRIWKPLHILQPTSGQVDPEKIKSALLNGPVWTQMLVYDDFRHYRFGIYRHAWGEIESGHTIAIIGYEDARKTWIVKNSWGDEWGDSGYGYIHYDDISGLGKETYQFVFNSHQPHAIIKNLSDHQAIHQVTQVTIASNLKSGSQIHLMAHSTISKQGQLLGFCQLPKCKISIDPDLLPEGLSRLELKSPDAKSLSTWPIEIIKPFKHQMQNTHSEPVTQVAHTKTQGANWQALLSLNKPVSKIRIELKSSKNPSLSYSKSILAPSQKNRLNIDLKGLPKGPYQVTIVSFLLLADSNPEAQVEVELDRQKFVIRH